jgi:hypothetical protein
MDGEGCESGNAIGHLVSCLLGQKFLSAMLMGSRSAVKARLGTSPVSK